MKALAFFFGSICEYEAFAAVAAEHYAHVWGFFRDEEDMFLVHI